MQTLVQPCRDAAAVPDPPPPADPLPIDLVDQCLQLQAQNQHQAVLDRLGPFAARFDQAPQAASLWHLQGISLYRLEQFTQARACYERALALQPAFPAALNSLGFVLQDLGRVAEARDAFARAVHLAPDLAMARLNLGLAQLKLGDFIPGWDNYEARWTGAAESHHGGYSRPPCPLPQWTGQGETRDQSLLVFTEQGFGDTFQFVRYLGEIQGRFAKVGFVCSAPTLRLMEWAFGDQVALFTRLPLDYATWHWHCPLLSLPRACATRLDTIPGTTPYLTVPAPARRHWRDRLEEAAPGRYRVGIAWVLAAV